jgi:hypothetical protein
MLGQRPARHHLDHVAESVSEDILIQQVDAIPEYAALG